jgi:acyl-CoA reductase-like NAD-dependent aldehyde dehydrogenase
VSETLTVIEPATEAVLEEVPAASADDVDSAVARARAAYPAWRALPPGDRAQRLRALADALGSEREVLARLEARNAGKPISDARGEMDMVVETFRYYAAAPERPFGETIPVAGGQAWTVREPLGVVGLIVPWNFPLAIAAWKLGPALAAGNTVVLKPAELTPLTALRFGQIATPILGEGVVNVVAGLGPLAGARLVEHPDVAKIAFTGSTRVGSWVAARAAAQVKRVTLELGGKSANIVFADADLEAAAATAPMAAFANTGQDCCARSRILVQRSVLDRFMSLLEGHVTRVRVGDPLSEQTEVGPLISAPQRERVQSFLDGSVEVAFRAAAPEGPGFWFPPTVLYPAAADARAVREEIFGPVTTIVPFEDEADAVSLANATIYGLSGSIWTENGARALRVARAVESGVLSINSNSSVRVSTPFGGFKQSGYGRELGPHATDAYTDVKTIFYATPPTPGPSLGPGDERGQE